MNPGISAHEPLLVNTVGHTVGALVFALSLYFLWRGRRSGARLPIAAAGLAFLWNLASLLVLACNEFGWPGESWLVAVSTSALSVLPAVLLHVSLGERFRWLVRAGYALGLAAVAMHATENLAAISHRTALAATTIGFGALTSIAVASLLLRGTDRKLASRLTGAMALFVFAMSLLHAGDNEAHGAWAIEILVHHAGVLVALVVLLQDYRFVLLDAFVRVLASLALAGMFLGAVVWGLGGAGSLPGTPFRQGLLLVGVSVMVVCYAVMRQRLQDFLTPMVFGRAQIEPAMARLRDLQSTCKDEREYLAAACHEIAAFLKAEVSPSAAGAEAVIPIRVGPRETLELALGHRVGGKRYLSEDLDAANRLAAQVTGHVEQFRSAEMQRLVAQAELRALESQIQPHFLFNVLNTLYGLIPRDAAPARNTVLNLADLLRYHLRQDRTYTTLEQELRIVQAYLDIEKLRLGERLRTSIDVEAGLETVQIPVLSLEPLVENAIKHGIAGRPDGGEVRVIVRRRPAGGATIRVEDTGCGFPARGEDGVGLANVRRRLALCYGSDSALLIESSASGSTVAFAVPDLQKDAAA